jgi:hypothetical protein
VTHFVLHTILSRLRYSLGTARSSDVGDNPGLHRARWRCHHDPQRGTQDRHSHPRPHPCKRSTASHRSLSPVCSSTRPTVLTSSARDRSCTAPGHGDRHGPPWGCPRLLVRVGEGRSCLGGTRCKGPPTARRRAAPETLEWWCLQGVLYSFGGATIVEQARRIRRGSCLHSGSSRVIQGR